MRECVKNPKFIFWVDLETTDLDPKAGYPLELAYILTEFEWPYNELYQGHFLIDGIGRNLLLRGECSQFITNFHEKSGLYEDIKSNIKSNNKLFTMNHINNELFALSELKFGSWNQFEKEEKVIIGGSSCHFDLSFLRIHFPEFTAKLSYRTFDATVLRQYCCSLGMPYEKTEEDNKKHRALDDIRYSIKLVKDCTAWLSVKKFSEIFPIEGFGVSK